MIKKNFWSFFLILGVFIVDRLSKISIINIVKKNEEAKIFESSYLNLNLIWNDGIAFGLFSFDQKIYYKMFLLSLLMFVEYRDKLYPLPLYHYYQIIMLTILV